MKKLLLLSAFAACTCMLAASAHGQVMLQKAVISSGGASSTNSTVQMGSTAGQPVVGVASNGQMIAHFGFWTPTAAAAAVHPQALTNDLSIETWPNPATEVSKITVTLAGASDLNLRLYNVTGAEVRNIYSGAVDGSRSFDLDLSGLAAGSYIVAAKIPGRLVEKRITILR